MTLFTYIQDDILRAITDYIIIPVNCVGVMGAGLAKQYKDTYPTAFARYKEVCDRGELVLGGPPLILETQYLGITYHRALLFPTKHHWRDKSNYHDIEQTLRHINEDCKIAPHISIAFPPIGAGLGGLDRGKIETLIRRHITSIRAVHLYDFQ